MRETLQLPYTAPSAPHWDREAQTEFEDIKLAIVSDPCLQQFDHKKLVIIRTDYSALGIGYVAVQPGEDKDSQNIMHRAMRSESFDFMEKNSKLSLHPIAFGSQRCCGNECRLHSHLGEGFAGH